MTSMGEGHEQRGLGKAVRYFDLFLTRAENLFAVVAAIMMFAMIIMVSYSVIGRKFFGTPGAWAVELSEYIMLYLAFLLAPWVLRRNGHVRVDILYSRLSGKARLFFDLAIGVLATLACLVLFWFSLEVAIESYERNVILRRIVQVPQYILLAVIPLGSLFLIMRLLCQMMQLFTGRRNRGRT